MANLVNQIYVGEGIRVELCIDTDEPLASDTWDRVKYIVGRIEALIGEVGRA